MNVLFLTIGEMDSIEAPGIYSDLLRHFRDEGHGVHIVATRERRSGLKTELVDKQGVKILYVHTGNITKCNLIEKGISTVLISSAYKRAINKYFGDIDFDLIIYSTPPITLVGVIGSEKKRTHAKTYLLLKDIFPQNAVDIGMFTKSGIKGIIWRYFRGKEKKLYAVSDKIGCMSRANCQHVLQHNPEIPASKVEVCPNSIEPVDMRLSDEEKQSFRRKYGLPEDKRIFVYGGNLGRPQDVPFIVECLKACATVDDAYFVIAGSGTDRHVLEEYISAEAPENVRLFEHMPKTEYDQMVGCCDVGLIFLDHRFTIPNFPSRLLSYMQAGLPVLACTDKHTDVGQIIAEEGFGWWCESTKADGFAQWVSKICCMDIKNMVQKEFDFLMNNYSVKDAYKTIVDSLFAQKGGN